LIFTTVEIDFTTVEIAFTTLEIDLYTTVENSFYHLGNLFLPFIIFLLWKFIRSVKWRYKRYRVHKRLNVCGFISLQRDMAFIAG